MNVSQKKENELTRKILGLAFVKVHLGNNLELCYFEAMTKLSLEIAGDKFLIHGMELKTLR